MKIVDIRTKVVSFKRRKVFKIAFGAGSDLSHRVYTQVITDSGLVGLGEAAPAPLVTGETVNGVITAVDYMKPALIGMDAANIAEIHQVMDKQLLANPAAKASIDIACYDILGKKEGLPVHTLLGAETDTLETDITIGIDTVETMVNEAVERVGEGFRVLKIKCGISPEHDVDVLGRIRAAVGDDIDLRIDINQGYDFETVIDVLNRIKVLKISEAEQPVPAWDVHTMAAIKKVSPIPIMADESVHTPEQARIVCEHDACDIINIKLMKCGGIYPALQISEIAKKYHKPCIVGCMSESRLGIAAAAAVVVAKDNIESADLDSFYAFTNPEIGVCGGFEVIKDRITLSPKSGFGFDEYSF